MEVLARSVLREKHGKPVLKEDYKTATSGMYKSNLQRWIKRAERYTRNCDNWSLSPVIDARFTAIIVLEGEAIIREEQEEYDSIKMTVDSMMRELQKLLA